MDTAALRKARGAFFTPPEIAAYVVRWALRDGTETVLEPSCGEAEFLLQTARQMAQQGVERAAISKRLWGVELHESSASEAKNRLRAEGYDASISTGDFFDVPLDRQFDVIVGNPPYVRYQNFVGTSRIKSAQAALAQGVRLSGLASSWAAFVLHSAGMLKTDGRLALVLPAELMSVSYAASVRSFLLSRFGKVRLVTFEERVFPGVLEDVVLLLAEGSGGAEFFELHQAKNAQTLASGTQEIWTEHSPAVGSKWTSALVANEAFSIYERVCSDSFEQLRDWGRTYLGAVTGNNRFFSLTGAEASRLQLQPDELVRISQPGSRHLRGLEFSESAWKAELDSGARCLLFHPRDEHSDKAQAYIEFGERQGVSTAYKCRARTPWWRVPLVDTPDLFLTYMNHDRPRLISNQAKARILNSLYGVKLKEKRASIGRQLLPIACLNSVTLLGAEVVGRAYGGGLLKLEPREADLLPLPNYAVLSEKQEDLEHIKPQLGQALRGGDIAAATEMVDRILLGHLTQDDLAKVRLARELLFQRRKSRGAVGSN